MPGPNGRFDIPPPGTTQGQAQVIACPWHTATPPWDEHPGGAPICFTIPENIALGKVIPLGHLISWITMLLSEVGPLVSVMWLHHLVEWGTDEAKDEARKSLEEMGETDGDEG